MKSAALATCPSINVPCRMPRRATWTWSYFGSFTFPRPLPPTSWPRMTGPPCQQLASLRFVTPDGIPNTAAILVFGKDPLAWFPGAYIQFARFEGLEVTDAIRHQKEIDGPMPLLLRQLDEVLDANVSLASDVRAESTGDQAGRLSHCRSPAVGANAVLHRTYEATNAPARVYWFSDRIEIHSPGGLYGQVNAENFGQPGITDYRNPLLAEAMKVLGYVQRFGMGIPLAKKELEKNGNPPLELTANPNAVLATVRRRT